MAEGVGVGWYDWQLECKRDTSEARRVQPAGSGVINRAFLLLIMSDGDDSAALWKVNRTIHELVKDRVQKSLS